MDFYELSRSMGQLWENNPRAVVLLVVGFIVFAFLVVDTWRHRRHRKKHHLRH